MRTRPRTLALVGCLLVGLMAPTLRAGELDKIDTSMKLVPADAAFYSSMLRNREQLEILVNSNAWKKFWSLPLVQQGWKQLQAQYEQEGGEFEGIKQFYADPANKEMMEVLADAMSHEIFTYGGKNFSGLFELLMHVNNSMSMAPLKIQLQGNPAGFNDEELMGYGVLSALSEKLDLLEIPDMVIGMKVSDKDKAEKQIARLEALAKAVLQDAPPPIRQRLQRKKVGGSSFLTFSIDGSLVPWDEVPIGDLEMKKGEFQPLLAKLQGMQLTVSIGVHHGYLMIGFGKSVDSVAKLAPGEGRLGSVKEVQPLAKFADKKLTSIDYVSKDFFEALGNPKQLDSLVEMANMMMGQTPLPRQQQQKILADIGTFVQDIKKSYPKFGAMFSFSFLTPRGQESYAYNYTENQGLDGSKPLTLLNHMGGNPILAFVSRTKGDGEGYAMIVKWVKIIYGHADDFIQQNLGEQEVQQYQAVTKEFLPLVKRFDEITRTQFFPSLDGQGGLAIDGKWKSKRWHQEAPPTPAAMPLPEVGLVLGLADSAKFVKSIDGYRQLANDVLKSFRKFAPPGEIPIQEVPIPKSEKQGDATLYYYPLPPQLGFDPQVQPTAGIAKNVLAIALSKGHVGRLTKSTPLDVEKGPLADANRNLASAVYFDFEALVETLTPWVQFGAQMAMQQAGGDIPEDQAKEIVKTVNVALDLLKCLKGSASVTYIEDGVTVTHSETHVVDLKE